MSGVAIFCLYFMTSFYQRATMAASEEAWQAFFCKEDAPAPAKMLDRRWQLTCETYLYEFDPSQGRAYGYITPSDRCFPPHPEFDEPPPVTPD